MTIGYDVPQNIIVMTVNGSCPTGFSAYNTVNGYYLRSAAAKDVVPAGSNTHNHTGADHTHSMGGNTGSEPQAKVSGSGGNPWARTHTHNVNIISGNPAGLTINSVNHEPLYFSAKLCKKD